LDRRYEQLNCWPAVEAQRETTATFETPDDQDWELEDIVRVVESGMGIRDPGTEDNDE
jgi:hypothetical protein